MGELQILGIRSTEKLWATSLAGVWVRCPYLHNGSVRTVRDLLNSPADRARSFHRSAKAYDTEQLGYVDEGAYLLDTSVPAHSDSGHAYGAELSVEEKRQLIEFLKTL